MSGELLLSQSDKWGNLTIPISLQTGYYIPILRGKLRETNPTHSHPIYKKNTKRYCKHAIYQSLTYLKLVESIMKAMMILEIDFTWIW